MTDQILKKLEEHDKRFDQLDNRLGEHDKKFEEHGKQLEKLDQQVGNIAKAVVNNQERLDKVDQKLENVATKDDVSNMMSTLDKIVGLSEKKDQELTFMGERVKRVEDQTEKNSADIQKIKPLVGLETN